MISQVVVNAQTEEEVMKPIALLFDGMRDADSAKVRRAFSINVKMLTSGKNKKGVQVIKEELLQNFLNAIGGKDPSTPKWNEKITSTSIKIDGTIAQVWTEYSFFVGDKFSHCGVNAFQLVKEGADWKIIHIMDTRRRRGCEESVSD